MEVPFIHEHDASTALLQGEAGDFGVLLGDPLHRIEQQQSDIGSSHRTHRPTHAIAFDPPLDAPTTSDAGCIGQNVGPTSIVDERINGIPRCPWKLEDHHPVLPEERVDQGGLAHVGPADDGDARWGFRRVRSFAGVR